MMSGRLAVVLLSWVASAESQDPLAVTRPCAGAWKGASWCKPGPPFEPRAAALVKNLTRVEKSGLILMLDLGVPRLDISPYIWWSEALHGAIAPFQHENPKPATCWPEPISVGSSFNTSLFRALGELTSTEGRGLQNGIGHTYWAPNVNIARDPRWGRGQETPGEDPTLTSSYASHFVAGMQGNDSTYLKVASTLKHFAAYSQETGRINDPVVVTSQDMEDTYLPAFEAGIKKGKASGIMCSYNDETFGYGIYGNGSSTPGQYNGVPSCANKGLLTDLARDEWGFDGYITTDCGAADYVGGFLNRYGYDASAASTVHAVLGAGVDTDCGGGGTPNWGNDTLLELMTNASTREMIEPLIDASLRRLFTVRMRLGHFDAPSLQPWGQYGLEHVDTPAHRELAMEAALQGFVLLKNDAGALPLQPKKKVAVLGPGSTSANWQLGNYHERAAPAGVLLSPCDGMKAQAGEDAVSCATPTNCTVGGNASVSTCFDSASKAAIEAADVVVVLVGVDGSQEAEGHDKTSLTLPGTQLAMLNDIEAAVAGTQKPVILGVMGGSAVDLTSMKASPTIRSIVWLGYPGQAGGAAIAKALYGAENKFGKLPITFYDEQFCTAANLTDYRMRPDPGTGYPGRTHRFYTGKPVYPFGAGLSYTSFRRDLEWTGHMADDRENTPTLSTVAAADSGTDPEAVVATLKATIVNTGPVAGDEVLLLFIKPPPAAVKLGAPAQQLAAFHRFSISAGGSVTQLVHIKQAHVWSILPQEARASLASLGDWQLFANADEGKALRFAVSAS